MKETFYILAILVVNITWCTGQNRYFTPEGITEKTEEYVKLNKSWTPLGDKESVDGYTRTGDSIFGGDIACNIEPLQNIDVETFEVLPGTKYARDKNHVFYPIVILCIDYTDCGVCYYDEIVIKNAKPKTFEYLGKDYAVDKQNAYFRGEKIPNANGLTFRVIEGPEYFYFAVDSNYVFRHMTIFKEADPATFYYDEKDERNLVQEFGYKIIIGDKDHEWQYSPPSSIEEIEKK